MERLRIRWHSTRTVISRWAVIFGALLALAPLAPRVQAFALLGPYDQWMVTTFGFQQPGDIGGPMNLGEEYRWNVPVVTYAFDQSFLDYFGSNGVAAVESAISTLNNLPPVSQIDPTTYPTDILRTNSLAQSYGLMDLKSQTLTLLLEHLGLASPTRFTFCVDNFSNTGTSPRVHVTQRNFDPIPSSFGFTACSSNVNDTAYTYEFQFGEEGTSVDAVEVPLDALRPRHPAATDGTLSPGTLYTGLSRDDVGGLRYLLATNNINWEPLLADVHGCGTNANTYANQMLRPGVDKITFVRRDYDSLLGQTFSPFTNQFIDTYVTNNTRVQQQLERVVTQPDFVFSAADQDEANPTTTRVLRTSTNWLPSPLSFKTGPGIIQPQVQIAFLIPGLPSVQTTDTPQSQAAYLQDYRWGFFEESTVSPIAYGVSAIEPAQQLTVQFHLHHPNLAAVGEHDWHVPVPVGSSAALQASTNLMDWVTLGTVTNHGQSVAWHHAGSQPQRFFRVVAQ